jgi:SAM-dependent methyltransferase
MEPKTAPDPFLEFKTRQREMWRAFAPAALFTTPVAGRLVRFAGIRPGEKVLDVGTGTGVVAITAARSGAEVTGLDLTPALLEEARENSRIALIENIVWTEGDAEDLPYADASYDVVLSQFGHIFAPRPEAAVSEIRRVLKPGGRFAFAAWPPEHFVGRVFMFIGRHSPIPPVGEPPVQWGDPAVITERLAGRFDSLLFSRGMMTFPALSMEHYRMFMERSVGPLQKLVESLAGDPEKLASVRAEFDELVQPYYWENEIHQDYLMTLARAARPDPR